MPLWWWPRQQGPSPATGRGMAIPRRRCSPATTVAATYLPFTNSGVAPSPLHRRGRAVVGPWRRRPLARSPASAAPTRLRSPSPWWRRLRVWHVTMSTTPSRPMASSTAEGVARPSEGSERPVAGLPLFGCIHIEC